MERHGRAEEQIPGGTEPVSDCVEPRFFHGPTWRTEVIRAGQLCSVDGRSVSVSADRTEREKNLRHTEATQVVLGGHGYGTKRSTFQPIRLIQPLRVIVQILIRLIRLIRLTNVSIAKLRRCLVGLVMIVYSQMSYSTPACVGHGAP